MLPLTTVMANLRQVFVHDNWRVCFDSVRNLNYLSSVLAHNRPLDWFELLFPIDAHDTTSNLP